MDGRQYDLLIPSPAGLGIYNSATGLVNYTSPSNNLVWVNTSGIQVPISPREAEKNFINPDGTSLNTARLALGRKYKVLNRGLCSEFGVAC